MLHPKRKPNRLKSYNYGDDSLYFVTICVNDRVSCFGDVDNNGIMQLNDYGKIAVKQWKWLEEQYPYIYSHAFVVMPNHVHAVLEINRDLPIQPDIDINDVGTGRDLSDKKRTSHDLSLQQPIKIKPLSQLIGAYKTTTSKQIHLLGYDDFKWQRSFHDHIIRNDKSYQNIIDYINENPIKWENDKYFMNLEQDIKD